ncbi:MAG TPA: hypothetical protein VGD37_20335, partial [Kofleriaceae bacterium]
MLKWLIRKRLAAFQRKFDYNVDYARDILDADVTAFFRFARLEGLSVYRRDVPLDVYYAVKLTSTVLEDCGPCTQLMVTMALLDGVAPRTVASVLEGSDALLADDLRLGVRFAHAVAAHDPAADELRDDIVRRWGRRALVSLAFAITSARIFPTIKYALGHGKACQRVVV